jgi:enamine deaminase RidA (YjgF/YER057c/UK114 family)
MPFEIINPESLGAPRGWSHGLLAPAGARILFVAGQVGVDGEIETQTETPEADFVGQFARALERVLTVVQTAGGRPEDIGRMTVYVTDIRAYRASLRPLGEAYRALMGRHYPAMALLEVTALVEPRALVEIEATALVP